MAKVCFVAFAQDWQSISNDLSVFTDREINEERFKEFPFVKRVIAERDLHLAFEMLSLKQDVGLQVAGLMIVEQLDPKLRLLAAAVAISSSTNQCFSRFYEGLDSPLSVEQLSQAILVLSTAYPESDASVGAAPLNYKAFFYSLDPRSLEAWYTNAVRLPCRTSVEYLALAALCSSYSEKNLQFTASMTFAIERGRTLPGVARFVYLSHGNDTTKEYRRCMESALESPESLQLFSWAILMRKAKYIKDHIDINKLSIAPEVLRIIERQSRRLDSP